MVSVVIPAYNEEKVIADCLNSLAHQKTKESFEVILVNNNSTDKTVAIAKEFEKKITLRIVNEKKKGSGAARARGFEEAKGDIIFTTDADTVVPENWIQKFMGYFADKKVIAVTSPCKTDDPSVLNRSVFLFFELIAMYGYRGIFGHFWLSGFSYAIRKDSYIQSGKINDSLPALDDIDLSDRVAKLGKIQYVHGFCVTSSHRRYKDNLLKGLTSYWMPWVRVKVFKDTKIHMEDYR